MNKSEKWQDELDIFEKIKQADQPTGNQIVFNIEGGWKVGELVVRGSVGSGKSKLSYNGTVNEL